MALNQSVIIVFFAILSFFGTSGLSQSAEEYKKMIVQGEALMEQREYDKAFELFLANAGLAPKELRGEFLLKAGLVLIAKKEYGEAIPYFESARMEAEALNNYKLLALSQINIGAAYTSLSKLPEGLYEYKQALTTLKRLGNDNLIAIVNFNLAHNYKEKALYAQALLYLYEAIKGFEKVGARSSLAKAYQTLGNVYREVGKDSLSIVYHHKSWDINKTSDDKKVISSNLNDLGNTYKNLYDYERALSHYRQSLSIGDSTYQATTLGNMAEVYLMMDDYSNAEKHFLKALALRKTEGNSKAIAYTLTELGGLYLVKNEFSNAHKVLNEGLQLAEDEIYTDVAYRNLELQQELFEIEGDLNAAYQLLKKSSKLKEKIFNENKQKVVEQMTITFEVRELEKQNVLLSEENKLQRALAEKEKANRNVLLLALILALLLISIVGYVYYQSRKKAQWQMAKRMEIQHRTKNFLQTLINLFQFQANNVKDPDARAIVQQSQSRIDAMMMIHRSLAQNMDSFNFTEYAKELVKFIHLSYKDQVQNVGIRWDADEVILNADQATPLALVLNELVSNAFKYAFHDIENPQLTITVKMQGSELQLQVMDNGPGINNLSIEDSDSEGLKLVKIFARQLNGKFDLRDNNGTLAEVIVKINRQPFKAAGLF